MNLAGGAIAGTGGDFEFNDLLLLEGFENPGQHLCLSPTPHPSVNGMPVSLLRREFSPFGPVFRDIQNRVEDGQIVID